MEDGTSSRQSVTGAGVRHRPLVDRAPCGKARTRRKLGYLLASRCLDIPVPCKNQTMEKFQKVEGLGLHYHSYHSLVTPFNIMIHLIHQSHILLKVQNFTESPWGAGLTLPKCLVVS